MNKRKICLGHLFLEGLDNPFLPLSISFDNLLPSLLKLITLESDGNLFSESHKKLIHLISELTPLPCFEINDLRRIGIFEIVHIAYIVRCCILLEFLQHHSHSCITAGSGKAGDKDIVALALNVQSQPDCPEGPLLAQNLRARIELIRRLEFELFRITLPSQFIHRDLFKCLRIRHHSPPVCFIRVIISQNEGSFEIMCVDDHFLSHNHLWNTKNLKVHEGFNRQINIHDEPLKSRIFRINLRTKPCVLGYVFCVFEKTHNSKPTTQDIHSTFHCCSN